MRLFTGVLCLSLAVLVFVVTLLGCRNPRRPRWTGDFLVANVYTTGILALGVYGVAELIRFFARADASAFPTGEAWLAGLTLAAALLAVRALRVRRTLAAYAATKAAAARFSSQGDDERPQPPAKPTRPRLAA